MRRLLDGRRPGRAPRHWAAATRRWRSSRALPGADPGPAEAHGLAAHPLVRAHRRLRQGLRRRRVARHQRVHPQATGSSAPTGSTPAATSAWAAPGPTSTSPPLGRQEKWEDSPEGYPQTEPYGWWNYHDDYGSRHDRPRRDSRSKSWRRLRAAPACSRRGRYGPGFAQEQAMNERPTLRMERTFAAPADRVFEAFTSEEVMRRWWHAGRRLGDPRGDRRRASRRGHPDRDAQPAQGRRYGARGRYTEVDPPRRLAFTWIWDDDTPTRRRC